MCVHRLSVIRCSDIIPESAFVWIKWLCQRLRLELYQVTVDIDPFCRADISLHATLILSAELLMLHRRTRLHTLLLKQYFTLLD